MSYTEEIYERVVAQNPGEPEFHQAVKEVLDSLKLVIDANEKQYRAVSLLERLVEPERIISSKVPWVDDNGKVQINKGYRVIQQRNWTVQGRSEIPSVCKSGHPEIPWF